MNFGVSRLICSPAAGFFRLGALLVCLGLLISPRHFCSEAAGCAPDCCEPSFGQTQIQDSCCASVQVLAGLEAAECCIEEAPELQTWTLPTPAPRTLVAWQPLLVRLVVALVPESLQMAPMHVETTAGASPPLYLQAGILRC